MDAIAKSGGVCQLLQTALVAIAQQMQMQGWVAWGQPGAGRYQQVKALEWHQAAHAQHMHILCGPTQRCAGGLALH